MCAISAVSNVIDSHESGGERGGGDGDEPSEEGLKEVECPNEPLTKENTEESSASAEPAYNPLIVRRSQRAIKPTKDIDLYLLGAKYGVDVEGSDADSSDLEFAPETASDGQ